MAITAADVKKLRDMTGVGMMDAKRALDESAGDMDKAVDALRKSGASKAAKKAERSASEGIIVSYIHPGGQVGVIVELNSETDFVARNDDFKMLASDIALHIAAMNPQYLKREDVPATVVDKEREIIAEQLKTEGKPAEMIEKITEGKLDKFYTEVVLLDQPFVKDDKQTVGELVTTAIQTIGENIQIASFTRYAIKGSPSCSMNCTNK